VRPNAFLQGFRCHTCDVLVEYVIFLDDIVDDLLGLLVDYEDFPLSTSREVSNRVQEQWHFGLSTHIAFCNILDRFNDNYAQAKGPWSAI
jgi:hypothetical protein